MPSTYTANTGIEKPATGEQSGVWGDTVNTNSDILDRALNGVGSIALSGTTHTLTTTDGELSDGMYRVLVFGGSPSGTNTVTIAPNDAQKLYFVQNDSGESVVLTQGSGSTVTVADGASAIVYADGAGAGAAVSEISTSTTLADLGITATASEINILDGVTATTAEINILDGVTATTAEINILDGVTATTEEINLLTGATSLGITAPATTTDGGVALFDGTDGSALKNGGNQNAIINSVTFGRGSTGGSTSIAIGKDAMSAGTDSAQACVAIGDGALKTINGSAGGADGSTAVGALAMGSGTVSGEDNTAVGAASGLNLTSGSNNLLLGYFAGTVSSPLRVTTESNRIVLGNDDITNAYIKVAFTVTSDERDKTDFATLQHGLDVVDAIETYTFKFDSRSSYYVYDENKNIVDTPSPDGTHKTDRTFVGFKAQQVRDVLDAAGFPPDVVVDTEDPEKLKMKETALIPLLINAIKELKTRVEVLESG